MKKLSKNNMLILTAGLLIFGATLFKVTVANESSKVAVADEGIKSLAYYVANIKEARAVNQECYDKALDMINVPDCANSLQALQMSYVGGDRTSAYKYNDR